jgi:type I restriction enzyme S subunit
MNGWREATLDELCTRITSGGTPSRKRPDYFCDPPEGHAWVKSQELVDRRITTTSERISEAGLRGSSAKELPVGAVLIAMYGANVGQLGYLGIKATVNQAICALIANPAVADARFLFYALAESRGDLVTKAHGAAQQNLSQQLIRPYRLRVPELDVQQLIGAVLRAMDDLIENNRRRIEILEEMARAIYREWFVHFRYPGHENATLADSSLGPVPDRWAVTTLGQVLELRYGKALKKENRRGGSVAVVSSAGVVGWHDEHLAEGPTIVVGRKGNVGSVTWVDGPSWPIDTAYYVETDLPQRYVVEQLRRTEFLNTHAAVPGLSREQAYSRPFLQPPDELMELFGGLSQVLAVQASAIAAQAERLVSVRDLLLPRLVTGTVDVSSLDLDALVEGTVG